MAAASAAACDSQNFPSQLTPPGQRPVVMPLGQRYPLPPEASHFPSLFYQVSDRSQSEDWGRLALHPVDGREGERNQVWKSEPQDPPPQLAPLDGPPREAA